MFENFSGNPKRLPCNIQLKSKTIIENCFPKEIEFVELQGEMRSFLKSEVIKIEYITWTKSEKLAEECEKKQLGLKPPKKKGKNNDFISN